MSDEKAKRSVFVGNIPYEATEDTLYQIFGEVGQVKGLRLVTDKETGKPKGYGFVEYADQSTAQSAIRNLSGREVHGRNLRVDSASQTQGGSGGGGQQPSRGAPTSFDQYGQSGGYQQQARFPPGVGKMEAPPIPEQRNPPAVQRGPPQVPPNQGDSSITPKSQAFVKDEGKYGEPVVPKDAPESISRAVASLPPEQMHQLMKEMKECINNNPHEARNMLLQNPQLAYALLQAQVSMRIVDPDIAMKMLHRQAPVQPLIHSGVNTRNVGSKEKLNRLTEHTAPSERERRREPAPPPSRQPQPKPVQPKNEAKSNDSNDREKAQLIMQVMNLTNDQINMLPLEQRRSILELRAQLQTQGGSQ